jgi:hypothetical protein
VEAAHRRAEVDRRGGQQQGEQGGDHWTSSS